MHNINPTYVMGRHAHWFPSDFIPSFLVCLQFIWHLNTCSSKHTKGPQNSTPPAQLAGLSTNAGGLFNLILQPPHREVHHIQLNLEASNFSNYSITSSFHTLGWDLAISLHITCINHALANGHFCKDWYACCPKKLDRSLSKNSLDSHLQRSNKSLKLPNCSLTLLLHCFWWDETRLVIGTSNHISFLAVQSEWSSHEHHWKHVDISSNGTPYPELAKNQRWPLIELDAVSYIHPLLMETGTALLELMALQQLALRIFDWFSGVLQIAAENVMIILWNGTLRPAIANFLALQHSLNRRMFCSLCLNLNVTGIGWRNFCLLSLICIVLFFNLNLILSRRAPLLEGLCAV